jgi:hypothetical protein
MIRNTKSPDVPGEGDIAIEIAGVSASRNAFGAINAMTHPESRP